MFGIALRRVVFIGLATLGVSLLMLMSATLVLSNTDWGRERVRRFVETQVTSMTHGRIRIGKLSGNLLRGATIQDASITDSAGNPFVAAEIVTADYSLRDFFRKRIWIRNVIVVRPVVVLDRPPGGEWNWRRIFPRSKKPRQPNKPPGWGDWLRFVDCRVLEGEVMSRAPWHPPRHATRTQQEAVIRNALAGRTRARVERVTGGYQRIMEFHSINARVPLLRLTDPKFEHRLITISSLQMYALPFREPGAVVRNVRGDFPFSDDSIWWKHAKGTLPQSKAEADGIYNFGNGDMRLAVHGEPVSSSDFRWVFPQLPSDGEGKMDFRLVWRGVTEDYFAFNADVHMAGAHATGSVGIAFDDTTTIHNTSVRFSKVDTRLIEQLVPGFDSPRRGTFDGYASASGGRHALLVEGDVAFNDRRAGRSRVVALGEVGILDSGLRARQLQLRLAPLQVELARTAFPSLPISGTITGPAVVNGSTNGAVTVVGDLDHRDRGARTALNGRATVTMKGKASAFDVDVNAKPASLTTIGRFFPSVGMHGSVAGPIRMRGTIRDFSVNTDLQVADGGSVSIKGQVQPRGDSTQYDFHGSGERFDLAAVLARAPATSLTGEVSLSGRGLEPATMHGTYAADFTRSSWSSYVIDSVAMRATIADGLATIQRFDAGAERATASLSGAFGLAEGRSGELIYRFAAESLGALDRYIPRGAVDTGEVAPRPMRTARAIAKARTDSARIDRATEVERAISGAPGPTLVVHKPASVRRETLEGKIYAAGIAHGGIHDFNVRGRAAGEDIVARGNTVERFMSEYALLNIGTPGAAAFVAVDVDSASALGYGIDTLSVRVSYKNHGGRVELAMRQGEDQDLGLRGDYSLRPERNVFHIASMRIRLDTALWTTPHPATIYWGTHGVEVASFELRDEGTARVYLHGALPTEGSSQFEASIIDLPLATISAFTQSTVDLGGLFSFHGTMTGPLIAPEYLASFSLLRGRYNRAVIPELHGSLTYADEELASHIETLGPDRSRTVAIDGRVPLNLAVSGVQGDRILPRPMAVDLVADSLPLTLIGELSGYVSNFSGHAGGRLSVRGTPRQPAIAGAMAITNGAVTISATGARVTKVSGSLHVEHDTIFVDSIVGEAKGPVRLRGSLGVAKLTQPSFNLYLVAHGAQLLDNDMGKVRVDAGIALTGPYKGAYLSGEVTVTEGVLQLPQSSGKHVIGADDPALFTILDSEDADVQRLFPQQSPFLANLRLEGAVNIRHDTWVRNHDANIEVYTEYPLMVRAEGEAMSITGAITTDRGTYTLFTKQFQIRRGSALFVGGTEINPTLQITAEYSVSIASRGAIGIQVLIGGTMRKPRLTLDSDAQPPRTQSELLTLLAFGDPTTSLLRLNGSTVTGSAAAGGDLVGVGARVAVRRLASVALGVLFNQVELEAGQSLGTDVLIITPANIPPELVSANGLGSFLLQTRIEAGKYVNPRTYVSVSQTGGSFGASIEQRTADGWLFTASTEPRFILLEPTLSGQGYRRVQAVGGFILREWRY